ncbi:MAG: phosphohydrolase [Armatimonadota bacterium]
MGTDRADGISVDRIGDWIQTYTGKQFWPLDPRPEDVCIEDIAHSLSLQCRFAGHTKEFYSVAQHCVLVARNVPPEAALWGLLHDATETYLVGMSRPLKRSSAVGSEYRRIENHLAKVIAHRFGLPVVCPEGVHKIDDRVLMSEARDLLGPKPAPWGETSRALAQIIVPWHPSFAEAKFLECFRMLFEGDLS